LSTGDPRESKAEFREVLQEMTAQEETQSQDSLELELNQMPSSTDRIPIKTDSDSKPSRFRPVIDHMLSLLRKLKVCNPKDNVEDIIDISSNDAEDNLSVNDEVDQMDKEWLEMSDIDVNLDDPPYLK